MRLNLLLDMNLSPDFATFLQCQGANAVHWTAVGAPEASDFEIMAYAAANDYTVLTLDLDFGAILAATQDSKPSVVQIRTKEALSKQTQTLIWTAISYAHQELLSGAILTIDTEKSRLRMLPIR
ncbi:MAG: DUF5615 family PIN-like protein [Clostridiales Family XIII bacterium]|jgi:predicted nuclease of predicted toxin-antitoxin system|nr:DUF5615 family PIN-like protein [Clostridiales Family XIII bacterium]